MSREPTTPEQQRIEDEFVATLSKNEMEYYRIHVNAGGRRGWQVVLDPEAPLYEGVEEGDPPNVPPVDHSMFDLTTATGCLQAAMAHSDAADAHFAYIGRHLPRIARETRQRLEASASELGLEHVLGR